MHDDIMRWYDDDDDDDDREAECIVRQARPLRP